MELSQIHGTFRNWAQELAQEMDREGGVVRFSHALEGDGQGLLVSAVLLTAVADPQRRAQGPVRRGHSHRPIARLRYLMCVGGLAQEAERALVWLVSRAQGAPGFTVMDDAPAPSLWLAYGVALRPAFLLEVGLTQPVQKADVTPVREHRVDLATIRVVQGRVLAADETPVAGAEVELIATGQRVRCDADGAFELSLPGDAVESPGWVRVQARGLTRKVQIPMAGAEQDPWFIHLEGLGG